MAKIKVIELFGGIGACSKALERLGIDFEITDYVEIDKYAAKSFNAVHGTSFEPQDIKEWDKNIECDLIMHGSPCQDFSTAGKQAGGDEGSGTRSSLMYETLRIVEKLRPKYVIWENVKNLLSKKHRHNFDAYLESMGQLGYMNYYKVLNAKDYGVPQNRERVFTISIRKDVSDKEFIFPEPIPLERKLKDMLESDVDEKYYLTEGKVKTIQPYDDSQKVKVKNATKKGYDLATEGDSINLQFPNSTTRRGRVGHGVSQTLMTCGGIGVVVRSNLKISLCNKLVKEGVVKGGEVINHSYTTSEQRNSLSKYIESNNGVMPTLTTRPDCLGYATLPPNIRIRKLTPKECWRLMGFDDIDIEKAQEAGLSNAQLYKQAGNSIVVDVLERILKNLLENEYGQ